jgi:hypothetical protein
MRHRTLFVFAAAACLLTASAAQAIDLFTPTTMPSSLSAGIGPLYDYTSRTLSVNNDGRVHFATNRIMLEGDFNPASWAGLRVMGGAGDMYFTTPTGFDKIGSPAQAASWQHGVRGFAAPFNFVGGGAVDFAPLRQPSLWIGIGLTGWGLYQQGSRDGASVRLAEYGGAFSLSLVRLATVVPYVGIDYAGIYGDIKSPAAAANFNLTLKNNPDAPIGMFAGISFVVSDHTRLGLEMRFLSELSGGASVIFHF